ncbi:MAG: signal peptidase II [Ilumatobacteraceae bacterium]
MTAADEPLIETDSPDSSVTAGDDGSAVDRCESPDAGSPGLVLPDTGSARARQSSVALSLGLATVVVAIDQVTKHWALRALSDGNSRHVFWTLHWNLTFNSGMAFSRGQGIGPYIGALAFVVVIALVLSLRRSRGVGSSIAVGLVVGGAIGNLADRLFRGDGWLHGSVVDFIDLEWWPIFNIADIGVTVGGVLILLAAVLDSRTRSR